MSILEKYSAALKNKDEATMNDLLHDDFKFTMHKSGNVLTKSDVIKWAMSGDINQDKVRIVYLNIAGIEDISLKGNIDDKIITIEDIDSKVIGPLLKETFSNNEIKMMVVVNHMNSAVDVKYGKDRVPFVMSGKNDTNLVNNFDENLLNVGNNHFKSGSDLMSMFFDLN